MKNKYLKGLVEKTAENKYRVVASTAAIDRQGDVIDQSGWITDNYMKNPVMLFAHNYNSLPVAKCISLSIENNNLIADFEFAPAEANPQAGFIKTLYDQGFMSAVSVGFIPKEQNGNIISKAELLEISFVPVPANQEALKLSYKSLDESNLTDEEKTKMKDVLAKGEVAAELNAEEMAEQKWEKFQEVSEVISALWTVYFDEATPVEDFSTLLTEAIDLLDIVASNDGADDDEVKSVVGKAIGDEAKAGFIKGLLAYEQKAGREISAANHDKIKSAHEHVTKAVSVLEDLMASSQSEDGKSLEEKVVEVKEDVVLISKEKLNDIRDSVLAKKHGNEFVLKIINDFLATKK